MVVYQVRDLLVGDMRCVAIVETTAVCGCRSGDVEYIEWHL